MLRQFITIHYSLFNNSASNSDLCSLISYNDYYVFRIIRCVVSSRGSLL